MNLFKVTKKQPSSGLELKTFTGNPVTFTPTYSEALPAPFNGINLKAAIVASGGYDADTQTSHPIVGHSELNLVRCGKNLINVSNEYSVTLQDDISCRLPANTYTISYQSVSRTPTGSAFLIQITWGGSTHNIYIYPDQKEQTFTADSIITNIRIYSDSSYNNSVGVTTQYNGMMLELGSTATAYAPYNGTPYLVSFGQTVYGGEFDAKAGKVTITHGYIELNSIDWDLHASFPNTFYTNGFSSIKLGTSDFLCTCYVNGGTFFNYALLEDGKMYSSISLSRVAVKDTNYSTKAEFVSAMAGKYLAYELATPIEIDVSSISVEAVSGVNNIVSDGGGDVEVQCLI